MQVRSLRFSLPLCDLCRRLHDEEEVHSSHRDLKRRWWNYGRCATLEGLRGPEGRFHVVPMKRAPTRRSINRTYFY